jgi:hypothetical protein
VLQAARGLAGLRKSVVSTCGKLERLDPPSNRKQKEAVVIFQSILS